MSAATKDTAVTHLPRATSAIVRHDPIEPSNMAELKDFAITASESGFFGAKTPQQAFMIALAGRDLGFSYTQALRAFDVINGRPALKADGMVAACLQRNDVCEFFRAVEQTPTKSTWETKRVGDSEVRRYTFTIEDAKAAQLTGKSDSNWSKYPTRMLSARAKSFLARDVYPELLMGLLEEQEAREIPERRGEQSRPIVAEVVEAKVADFSTEVSAVMEKGASLETPAERVAYWKSIADVTKAWPKADRDKAQSYFRSLDEAHARGEAVKS